jgi:hypothetical protein
VQSESLAYRREVCPSRGNFKGGALRSS